MPNVRNDTEDEVEYEMDDGRPDGGRDTLHSFSLDAKAARNIPIGSIPSKIVNHTFRSKKTGAILTRVNAVPREHDTALMYSCETKKPSS